MSGSAVAGFAADAGDPDLLHRRQPDQRGDRGRAEEAAFEAENPDIKIEIETHPGGGEGDNLVKTRLATGDMPDVFRYNAGSLFRALNPPETMLDLTNEPFVANVIDSFKPVVSVDGKVYGVPEEAAMGGGVLYNKKIYADLGLSVPEVLGRVHGQQREDQGGRQGAGHPDLRRHLDQPALRARRLLQRAGGGARLRREIHRQPGEVRHHACRAEGLQRQEEVFKAGYLNEDFAAAKFDDGLRMVATGEGAHYPMLTFAIGGIAQNYPDNLKDVGFFAMPGDDAASNGLTVWMPAAVYIAKTTEHPDEAKRFVAFIASTKGCDVRSAANGATGPYLIKGCTLPADVPPAVADLLPYFEKDRRNRAGARVPVADQGAGARADHRRGRLRHPLGRRRRRAL